MRQSRLEAVVALRFPAPMATITGKTAMMQIAS
jgi:hypothetical protein